MKSIRIVLQVNGKDVEHWIGVANDEEIEVIKNAISDIVKKY